MKFFLVFLLYISCSQANQDLYFKTVGNYLNINYYILKTLSKVESDQTNYSFNIQTKSDRLINLLANAPVDNYNFSKKNNKFIFSIRITTLDDAKIFYKMFEKYKKDNPKDLLTYDFGIMQINEANIKRLNLNEKKYYLDTSLNIFLGAHIYKYCSNKYRSLADSLECYHHGPNKNKFNYSYFNKFYKKLKENE